MVLMKHVVVSVVSNLPEGPEKVFGLTSLWISEVPLYQNVICTSLAELAI